MKTWELLSDYRDLVEGDQNKMEVKTCPACGGRGCVPIPEEKKEKTNGDMKGKENERT